MEKELMEIAAAAAAAATVKRADLLANGKVSSTSSASPSSRSSPYDSADADEGRARSASPPRSSSSSSSRTKKHHRSSKSSSRVSTQRLSNGPSLPKPPARPLLFVTTGSNHERIWDTIGSPFKHMPLAFFRPIAPEGYYSIGDVAQRELDDYVSKGVIFVQSPGTDIHPPLLAPPLDWEKKWDSTRCSSKMGDCSIWWPIAPPGYKALGCVVSSTLDTKPTDRTDIMCVFGSCTCPASVETDALWSYARARGKSTSSSSSSNVSQLISIWRSKASSQAALDSGCFFVGEGESPPKLINLFGLLNPEMHHEVHKTLVAIWSRKLTDLPVPSDLPRMSNGLKITAQPQDQLIFLGEKRETVNQLTLEVLTALLQLTEPRETVQLILDELSDGILAAGDVALPLRSFFASALIQKAPRLEAVLRLIHQEIPFPVIKRFRDSFYDKFPFKDCRGTWKIRIEVAGKSIVVSHVKSEQAHSHQPEEYFRFSWSLDFYLNSRLTSFTSDFYISEISFGEQTSLAYQQKVKDALMPFCKSTFEYSQIWERPLALLPVAKSLVTFLQSGLTMHLATGELLFSFDPTSQSIARNLFQFLMQLAGRIDPGVLTTIEGSFYKIVTSESPEDVAQQLRTFLRDGGIPESSKFITFLKLIHTDIVYPAAVELRQNVYDRLKYTDLKGSWRVAITLFNKHCHSIVISKKELGSLSHRGNDFFEFEWQVKIDAMVSLSRLLDAKFNVLAFGAHESMAPERVAELSQTLKAYLPGPCMPYRMRSYSFSDILEALATALQASPNKLAIMLPGTTSLSDAIDVLRYSQYCLREQLPTLPPVCGGRENESILLSTRGSSRSPGAGAPDRAAFITVPSERKHRPAPKRTVVSAVQPPPLKPSLSVSFMPIPLATTITTSNESSEESELSGAISE